MRDRSTILSAAVALVAAALLSGCTAIGAGTGALLGAGLDHHNPARGALLGAAAGALAGAAVDAEIAHAAAHHHHQHEPVVVVRRRVVYRHCHHAHCGGWCR
ncbi:MAG: hypothetical protein KatS3mg102_0258 [Planctomycetota bacterium]|nr:MAG: hypothetical protein KatS3mg102_0258 [Planctomycetota bacterium]